MICPACGSETEPSLTEHNANGVVYDLRCGHKARSNPMYGERVDGAIQGPYLAVVEPVVAPEVDPLPAPQIAEMEDQPSGTDVSDSGAGSGTDTPSVSERPQGEHLPQDDGPGGQSVDVGEGAGGGDGSPNPGIESDATSIGGSEITGPSGELIEGAQANG
jgi:hypothetical protein